MNKQDRASFWRFIKEMFEEIMSITKLTARGMLCLYGNRTELVKEFSESIQKFSKEESETE